MIDAANLEQFEVIATAIPWSLSNLPQRLDPIYCRREDGRLFRMVDVEESDSPPLEEVPREHLEVLLLDGDAVSLPSPIAARPSHWLIQLNGFEPPAYVPRDQVQRRLQEESERALVRAAEEHQRGHSGATIGWLRHACRAIPRDPLPLLVLIELYKGKKTERYIEILREDLAHLGVAEISTARRRLKESKVFGALHALIKPPVLKSGGPASVPSLHDMRRWTSPRQVSSTEATAAE